MFCIYPTKIFALFFFFCSLQLNTQFSCYFKQKHFTVITHCTHTHTLWHTLAIHIHFALNTLIRLLFVCKSFSFLENQFFTSFWGAYVWVLQTIFTFFFRYLFTQFSKVLWLLSAIVVAILLVFFYFYFFGISMGFLPGEMRKKENIVLLLMVMMMMASQQRVQEIYF